MWGYGSPVSFSARLKSFTFYQRTTAKNGHRLGQVSQTNLQFRDHSDVKLLEEGKKEGATSRE